eukprot:m.471664 g.471664  ORF g.471664 m.471664 type:complete len:335 (-) comp31437_c0_seq1:73-1077(-)
MDKQVRQALGGKKRSSPTAAAALRHAVLSVTAGVKPAYLYDQGTCRAVDLATAVSLCRVQPSLAAPAADGDSGPQPDLAVLELVQAADDSAADDGWSGIEPADKAKVIAALFVVERGIFHRHLQHLGRLFAPINGGGGSANGDGGSLEHCDSESPDPFVLPLPVVVDASGESPHEAGPDKTEPLGSALAGLSHAVQSSATDLGQDTAHHVPIVSVVAQPEWPLAAVVGALLGYPVVYTTSPDGRTCLSGRDLQLWELRCAGGIADSGCGETIRPDGFAQPITAFTVPAALVEAPRVAEATAAWRQLVLEKVAASTSLADPDVRVTTVNYPSVSL